MTEQQERELIDLRRDLADAVQLMQTVGRLLDRSMGKISQIQLAIGPMISPQRAWEAREQARAEAQMPEV